MVTALTCPCCDGVNRASFSPRLPQLDAAAADAGCMELLPGDTKDLRDGKVPFSPGTLTFLIAPLSQGALEELTS